MPEPDPQPTQPRPVPFWKWLLLLLPSVPILLAPLAASTRQRLPYEVASEENIGIAIYTLLWGCSIAIVLSIFLGLLLEKWLYGESRVWLGAIVYGLSIFVLNCLAAFAGCAVGAAIH